MDESRSGSEHMFNILSMWTLNSETADSPSRTHPSVSSLPHFLRLVVSCIFSHKLFSLPIFIFVFASPSHLTFLSLFLRTLRIYKSLTHSSPSFPTVLARFLSVSLQCFLCFLTVCWLVCNHETPCTYCAASVSVCLHLFS